MLRAIFTLISVALVPVSAAFDAEKWADTHLKSAQHQAMADYQEGRIGLVGFIVADGEEVPARDQAGSRDMPVRMLNRDWHRQGDIQQHPSLLFRTRGYALRYNLKMLQLLKRQEYQDRMKYRY